MNTINTIVKRNAAAIAPAQWNEQQLELIKSQIAPNCSDAELSLFGQVCQRTGLDPFARQIYALKRGSGDRAKMTIQVSIDGFRLIADRSGKYAGSETLWCAPDGVWREVWLESTPPAAAKTVVWKLGCDRPFTGVARWDSYKQEFNGKLSDMWARMSDIMLGKCSEALALRKAFPAELSGLYTSEEMAQATEVIEVNYTPSVAPSIISERQLRQLFATANELGLTDEEQKQIVTGMFGFESRKHITTETFDAILNAYKTFKKDTANA